MITMYFNIIHSQLRDLIICPRERGIVNYVQQKSIVEQDINAPGTVSSFIFLVDTTLTYCSLPEYFLTSISRPTLSLTSR